MNEEDPERESISGKAPAPPKYISMAATAHSLSPARSSPTTGHDTPIEADVGIVPAL